MGNESESLVCHIASTYYDITPLSGSIKQLCGYSDKNFVFADSKSTNTKYALKIVNPNDSSPELTSIIDEILTGLYNHCHSELRFAVPEVIRTTGNQWSAFITDPEGRKCQTRLCKYFNGITLADFIKSNNFKLCSPNELYFNLGKCCHGLTEFLRQQDHLIEKIVVARGNDFVWTFKNCRQHIQSNLDSLLPDNSGENDKRALVEEVLKQYDKIKDEMNKLPLRVCHGDLSTRNILLNGWRKICFIDFQDLQAGIESFDLILLILYSVLEQDKYPFEEALHYVPYWIYSGYSLGNLSNSPVVLHLMPTLMRVRLCQSLLNGLKAYKEDPSNDYVLDSNRRGWELLALLVRDERFKNDRKLIQLIRLGPPRDVDFWFSTNNFHFDSAQTFATSQSLIRRFDEKFDERFDHD